MLFIRFVKKLFRKNEPRFFAMVRQIGSAAQKRMRKGGSMFALCNISTHEMTQGMKHPRMKQEDSKRIQSQSRRGDKS